MALRRFFSALVLVTVAAAVYVAAIGFGAFGEAEHPGEITARARPIGFDAAREQTQRDVASGLGAPADKQILFGDLHVHTTYSADAFLRSLPLLQGEGAHPPADACDFARFCSALDFFSLNDHAEGLVPRQWTETKQSIRSCNAVAGDPTSPDLVAYLGWEWTQMGRTPDEHYGHKNVVLRDLADDAVPTRPIAATGTAFEAMRQGGIQPVVVALSLLDFANRERYFAFGEIRRQLGSIPLCPSGVDVRELPNDCVETAATPRELFEKLEQWGHESIVIPHGNAWGNTTPAGVSWDRQLAGGNHDPNRQRLIEVYSGHGNSEEYRPWRSVEIDSAGHPVCPTPTATPAAPASEGAQEAAESSYEAGCWRAGEIVRARCAAAGVSPGECDTRAAQARTHYVEADDRRNAWLTVPGQQPGDWLDAGQCSDCFQPAFSYRPGGSTQYALSLRAQESGTRFRFGLIASSDNHTARAGSGYKEVAPTSMTDLLGAEAQRARRRLPADPGEPLPRSRAAPSGGFFVPGGYVERSASFYYTGGLVGVHSAGRDRGAIWNALKRRETYGTSGPRILLWFDLLDRPSDPNALQASDPGLGSARVTPMGGEVAMGRTPRFRVRAVGALKQKPGCPEHVDASLGAERLEFLCRGECYHPSDERWRIDRIEVVRIRPQLSADEDPATLIDDPWRVIPCELDPAGCTVDFDDSTFAENERDTVYYVRAIQESTLQINGDGLRCERDTAGRCLQVRLCQANEKGSDDCLGPDEARAWSSPIFVDFEPEAGIEATLTEFARAH